MSWVKKALAMLERCEIVQVRPFGGSMRGRIESGQMVSIEPATIGDINTDDVVFIRWKGNYLLHMVKAIEGDRVLIGNNIGRANGWVSSKAIIGKVTDVED